MSKSRSMPFCAVCQKPVDEVRCWYDEMRRQRVYEARCHGAVERCELTDYTLAMVEGNLRFGEAFKRAALPEGTLELPEHEEKLRS